MAKDDDVSPAQFGIGCLLVLVIGLVGLVVLFTPFSFHQVPEGNRGVETYFGERINEEPLEPGLHFAWALLQDVKTFSVRVTEQNLNTLSVKTNEGLNVEMDTAIRYRLTKSKVNEVFDNIGTWKKVKGMVRNSFRTELKNVADHYDDEDLYKDKRTKYAEEVEGEVTEDLSKYGITVDRVMISNVNLPSSVETRIQEKISAAHKIEEKQRMVKVENKEAERKRVEAEGIRDAQKIINETLTDNYLQYYWIKEGLKKGDAMYVPIGNGGIPIMKDVDKTDK